jgi:hypothetical protein
MRSCKVRELAISLAVATLAVSYAAAQTTPVDPSTASRNNPNPANSTTTDDEGNNPLAREGDHSPTGQNSENLPKVGNPSTPQGAPQGNVGQAPSRQPGSAAGSSSQDFDMKGVPGGRAVGPD